jgi:hypothetical protein
VASLKRERINKRRGFMNLFFAGAVMIVLFSFLVFTKEASDMRFRRRELENMLKFDYRVETYYLLLETGHLSMEKEKGYGSFDEYMIREQFEEDRYIEIKDMGDRIVIAGSLSGVGRGYYEIRK